MPSPHSSTCARSSTLRLLQEDHVDLVPEALVVPAEPARDQRGLAQVAPDLVGLGGQRELGDRPSPRTLALRRRCSTDAPSALDPPRGLGLRRDLRRGPADRPRPRRRPAAARPLRPRARRRARSPARRSPRAAPAACGAGRSCCRCATRSTGSTSARARRRCCARRGSARELGVPGLLVKDEGLNPTGSFKARGMAAAVSRAAELGATALVRAAAPATPAARSRPTAPPPGCP